MVTPLEKLRQLVQIDAQKRWRCCFDDFELAQQQCPPIDPETWQPVELNEKGYIVWSKGRTVCWLAQRFVIPPDLQGYPLKGFNLRFLLTWWADEAKIFVNRQLVQEGDLFESSVRLLLAEEAIPGEAFTVALRLVSPGHDIGGLMRSRYLFEQPRPHCLDPGFIADELTVLQRYWQAFAPEKLPLLATELEKINWDFHNSAEAFHQSLTHVRQTLEPHAASIKQRCITMLSHAHLDMAWLWEVEETWEVAERTFESVLNLQKNFPDLTFGHTSPVLYQWIEKNRPALFAEIQEAAGGQSWEVLGGMWVEPEVNLASGEAIARQLLYGQRYTKAKFGNIAKVAWLTDSFGFCWQLPQLLKQGGIEYFVTQKLHWNDTTKFPHGAFWWQSPDGSRVFTLMSPPNLEGVMDTNPITMISHAVDWELQTGLQEIFWLPGVGDRGGGPSRDMLEVQQRWRQSPFFPHLEFGTARGYLQGIERILQSSVGAGFPCPLEFRGAMLPPEDGENRIPIWNDELYLEFHRGCYTTHADQKRYNRRCEGLLYQAELWSTLAKIMTEMGQGLHSTSNPKVGADKPDNFKYGRGYPAPTNPQSKIETAWKKVLFNQFHDILPGTSIPEVFGQANQDWEDAIAIAEDVLGEALNAIASQISLPPPPHPDATPFFIFNSLNWNRSEVISLPLSGTTWELYNSDGKPLPCQCGEETLLFLAQDIPSVGYRLFWMRETSVPHQNKNLAHPPGNPPLELENELLRVAIAPETGEIHRIFDKVRQRDILNGAGNQLQAFQDEGQYWDAWNIDPNYQQHPLPSPQLHSIAWIERGNIRQRLRVIRRLNASVFTQDYILDTHSPILKIATTVDWQERHILIKAAFPLNLHADFATYEIPYGAIQRTTKPQTPTEKAKWEVPALQWADLSAPSLDYGVSLLNDSKYGYDATPDRLRLTLLRGSMWPDPDADKGIHRFTYALYPHPNSWQKAKTFRKGYELNQPLQFVICPSPMTQSPSTYPFPQSNPNDTSRHLNSSVSPPPPKHDIPHSQGIRCSPSPYPPSDSLLHLSAENLILTAFKPTEDNPDTYVLRCYESCGEDAELSLRSPLGLTLRGGVDLLEEPVQPQHGHSKGQVNLILPWEIASFVLSTGEEGCDR